MKEDRKKIAKDFNIPYGQIKKDIETLNKAWLNIVTINKNNINKWTLFMKPSYKNKFIALLKDILNLLKKAKQ
jgi:hypothetical protein